MAKLTLLFIVSAKNQERALDLARKEIKKKGYKFTVTKIKILQKRPRGSVNTYALYGRPSKR